MSNYSQTTFFAPKDALALGNPAKIIYGAQVDPELAAISVAIATKYDSSSIATGPILFAAGTAALPSITFTGGTNNNTGMFLPAANQLGLATNGVAALEIDTGQNIGIATPSAATPVFGTQVGYLETPVNNQAAPYTLVLSDRGKFIDLTATGQLTIPANASVAFPVGTTLLVYSGNATGNTIAITTDTLIWIPSAATGTRTVASHNVVTLYKVASTQWFIWGNGIS